MRYFGSSLLLVMTLLLSACNTTPYDKATIYYDRIQFPTQLVKDYPELTGPILQHGRCSVIISTPGSSTGTYYFCTYALTANDLYVQGWDAKALKYVEIAHVELSALRKVALHTFFRTSQLQLTEDRRQLALSASIDEGGYIDSAATERLFDAIKNKGVPVVKSEGMINPPAPPSPMIIPIVIPK
ncbi:hypothetical protein SAMN03159443_05341 [Pseudomonas sp. NFACC15-1]|uniref:hypothetical protein n=1 Tax=unclassified Pseudomonas TaxID=196821 RepID=UPI0008899CF3|nr:MULTISPECIES: hypothetical protein [unclassified Pseudomonas]SDA94854.1 hypothetical protein SAMN03159443_05341 [Pseudomonas sp. NFACC15-1]SDY70967.1 hypothetical protein SAMN03159380_04551 [Pseudomonas sp. NFACC14]